MVDDLDFVGMIDRLIPNLGRKVSLGVSVKALILNAMGFSQHALYLSPFFFERCPVGHLLGPGLVAGDINDDSLGRALDAMFEYGVNRLFVQLSAHACKSQGLDEEFNHVDTTNFSLEGDYRDEGEGVKIAHGHPKDGRVDLKQVVLGLVTAHQTAIPRYIQVFDGNKSDKEALPSLIKNYISCLAEGEPAGIFISDAGIYSAGNISGGLSGAEWITRPPNTIGAVKALIAETPAGELVPVAALPGYSIKAVASNYGGVAQRWVLVHSGPLGKAVAKTLGAKAAKQVAQAGEKAAKAGKQLFKEQGAAEAFVEKLEKKYPLAQIAYMLKEYTYYVKKGKPLPENRRTGFQFDTIKAETNQTELKRLETIQSRFVLSTNVLDKERLPDEKILIKYKTQASSVENSFKFLKDPIFFAESFFVKNTGRLEVLLMIMCLSLIVYSLCERKLRQALLEKNETVESQAKKQTNKPTMRMVLNQFRGIHFVSVSQDGKINNLIANLNANQKKIITLLGTNFAKYYILRV